MENVCLYRKIPRKRLETICPPPHLLLRWWTSWLRHIVDVCFFCQTASGRLLRWCFKPQITVSHQHSHIHVCVQVCVCVYRCVSLRPVFQRDANSVISLTVKMTPVAWWESEFKAALLMLSFCIRKTKCQHVEMTVFKQTWNHWRSSGSWFHGFYASMKYSSELRVRLQRETFIRGSETGFKAEF